MMRKVTLYSRPGCHLCEEVMGRLRRLQREIAFHIEEVNIDEDPTLRRRYNEDVPVLAIDGHEAFKHQIDVPQLKEILAGKQQD